VESVGYFWVKWLFEAGSQRSSQEIWPTLQFLEKLPAMWDRRPSSIRQYWREIISGCREMARVDRIKEEIGWLKVPFGLLAVVDASLLGWLAQSYTKASPVLVAASTVAVIVVSSGIFQLNRVAYRLFDDLEES
jgi:hypothetical protein